MNLEWVSSSQHPWDITLMWSATGGGLHMLQTFVIVAAKNCRIHVTSGMIEVTKMMVARGRVSWNEGRRWHWTAARENEGGGRSTAVMMARGGNEAVGAKRKTPTQQSIDGEGGL